MDKGELAHLNLAEEHLERVLVVLLEPHEKEVA